METRAAVAHEAGKPLNIETVQLDGPRDGEVLVEVKATGVCHTDAFTLSGDDPEGLFPAILGHEGAGVVVETVANMIVGVDINPARKPLAEKLGMTHFVDANEVGGDLVPFLVNLTNGGADYSFECIGNVDVMRDALECCHKGWGVSTIIGVAPAGAEIATRPFQLVTGRVWQGTAFGGAKGRSDVPKIVDWYMEGKIVIDDLITHTMPLDDINKAFDLMHAGASIRSVIEY